jgi:hypothetical protein
MTSLIFLHWDNKRNYFTKCFFRKVIFRDVNAKAETAFCVWNEKLTLMSSPYRRFELPEINLR